MIRSDVIRVLEVDAELGQDLEPAALAVARPRAIARAMWLEPGRWQPSAEEWDHRGHLGLLIVDGFLARTLRLGGRRGVEILGPGDVLRPWVRLADYSSVPLHEGWDVLEPTRLAVLDGPDRRRVRTSCANNDIRVSPDATGTAGGDDRRPPTPGAPT